MRGSTRLLSAAMIIATPMVILLAAVAMVTQPFAATAPSQPPAVDPTRLEAHVRYLSETLYPRSFDQFENIARAAGYIQDEFKALGVDVTVQEVVVEESRYRNIIGRFGPESGPLTVIGAHYDSHGDASKGARFSAGYDRSTHTPGADDNASGVAGLIELASLLQRHPPSHPVELVAYTLEEPPHFRTEHMGSAWHANSLLDNGKTVSLMLSLEMIGFFSDEPGSQHFPVPGMSFFYPSSGNFIALVGRVGDMDLTRNVKSLLAGATDLPVYSINAPSFVPGIDFSDHMSYWRQGYPALMVTDTAFYRNPGYHTADDTYDKLDYERMAKVVQAVYAVTQGF